MKLTPQLIKTAVAL